MSVLNDEFTKALKQRIQTDAPDQFSTSGWKKIALGKFYPGVDDQSSLTLINAVVGTVLGAVLKAHNLCLTDAQLNQFFAGITTDMKPPQAIDRMLLASGMAVPCPAAGGAL